MKTMRKKSVAEGDGGDAAPAANVKVRQQTRAASCVMLSCRHTTSTRLQIGVERGAVPRLYALRFSRQRKRRKWLTGV